MFAYEYINYHGGINNRKIWFHFQNGCTIFSTASEKKARLYAKANGFTML